MHDQPIPGTAVERRWFVRIVAGGTVGLALTGMGPPAARSGLGRGPPREELFQISLDEWSLHRSLESGELDNLDLPKVARRDYGLEAVEYVNTFFKDRAGDERYLRELRMRCEGEGVRSLLVMCDGEGRLGDPDPADRTTAIENHYRWVEAARSLGCHSIRVNAASTGSRDRQRALAADGLHRLAEYGDRFGIDVIVENHGGLSSDGAWLASVIEAGDHARLGTLPDFGNFRIADSERYDNYRGVEELMPYARAVSAKSRDFDAEGNERELDYESLIRIVLESGYRGWIGIEYEGERLSEPEGVRATKALLERVRATLAPEFAA